MSDFNDMKEVGHYQKNKGSNNGGKKRKKKKDPEKGDFRGEIKKTADTITSTGKAITTVVDMAKLAKRIGQAARAARLYKTVLNDPEWYANYDAAEDVHVNMYSPYSVYSTLGLVNAISNIQQPYAPHVYALDVYKPLSPGSTGQQLVTMQIFNDLRSKLRSNLPYGTTDLWNYLKAGEFAFIAMCNAIKYLRIGVTHSMTDAALSETLGEAMFPAMTYTEDNSFADEYAVCAPKIRKTLATFKTWMEEFFPVHIYAFDRAWNLSQYLFADEDSDYACLTMVNQYASAYPSSTEPAITMTPSLYLGGEMVLQILITVMEKFMGPSTSAASNVYPVIAADLVNAYGRNPFKWEWAIVDEPMFYAVDDALNEQLRNARMEYLSMASDAGTSVTTVDVSAELGLPSHIPAYNTALTNGPLSIIDTTTASEQVAIFDKEFGFINQGNPNGSVKQIGYPISTYDEGAKGPRLIETIKLAPAVDIEVTDVSTVFTITGHEVPIQYRSIGLTLLSGYPKSMRVAYGAVGTETANASKVDAIDISTWNGSSPLQSAIMLTNVDASGTVTNSRFSSNMDYDHVAFIPHSDLANAQELAIASLFKVNSK